MGDACHDAVARRGEWVERFSGAAPSRPSAESGSGNDSGGQLLRVRIVGAGENMSVVSLAGELDLSTIPAAEDSLLDQLRSHTGLIVDLTSLRFIDSSGIGLLIQADRAAGPRCEMHVVVAPGSQVERVFDLAGIQRAMPVFSDLGEAAAALN